MIAYDELCAQLARWRSKNGMANGASAAPRMRDNTGERPAQYVPPAYSPPAAYAAQPSGPPPSTPPAQFTPPQGYAAAAAVPAYAPAQFSPPTGVQGGYAPADLPPPEDEIPSMFDEPAPGDMTEVRGLAAPPPAREDETGEIDIDSIDVVDEEEVT